MEDFESPLDLDGDGDDAMEMSILFDDDKDEKRLGQGSGCCVILVGLTGSLAVVAWGRLINLPSSLH